jgi:hypothetical protein
VSSRRSSAGPPTRGKRHPLLYQERLNEQVFWPCVGTIAASVALLVWNPAELAASRPHLVVILVGAGLVLVLTFLLRLMAYVQCGDHSLQVHLPFYRLTIPYDQVRATRPTELYRMFPPAAQRWTQRSFLRSLFGRTVLVLELDELPRHRIWLRLWMGRYMLCPDAVGLILPVHDWIAFRTELDEFRSRRRPS